MSEAAQQSTDLLPSQSAVVKNCLVGDNFAAVSDQVLLANREKLYGERSVIFNPVSLLAFPKQARLCGGRNFLLVVGDTLIKEQVPPAQYIPDAESLERQVREVRPEIHVDDECVLVSRYGMMTWGHWIGELLPRILIAETFFPKRFKYVLPQDIYNSTATRSVWNSIWESIAACGVEKHRVVAARYDRDYVFSKLHGVTSVITAEEFHPGWMRLIRGHFSRKTSKFSGRKIALLRTESTARNISNLQEVFDILKQNEFEFVEIGRLPFYEQIHVFSSAQTVVGVLASGLTGILFCEQNCKFLSIAPKGYLNSFFYSMMRNIDGRFYDVRGDVTKPDPRGILFSDFHIRKDDLALGLRVLSDL